MHFKLSQQNNTGNNHEEYMSKNDSQFTKQQQKQKKRSKGQRLDSQLLGFTVQPDPNLKNRGDIDSL